MIGRRRFAVLLLSLPPFGCGGANAPVDENVRRDAARDLAVDVDEPNDAAEDLAPKKLGAPYPIVLAHGFFGFEDFAGSGFVNYFYGVKAHLAKNGETQVFTPAVDPWNSSAVRGKQLAAHVKKILADTGYEKLVIVGHSQGGLDARVVAHDHPDLVAAVVTFGTPHDGVPIADIALRIEPHSKAEEIIDEFAKLIGKPLYDEVGKETSMAAAVRQFSTAAMKEFNAKYTDAFGVKYWSITGRTGLHPGGVECAVASPPDFVKRFEKIHDTTDPLLKPSETVLSGWSNAPNDGLVRVKEARWGTFLGCVPADHLDEMGHLLGDSPGPGNTWRHLDFYLDLVRWLRAQGF